MLVMGIDPGTAITGFGCVRESAGRLAVISYGAVRTAAGTPAPERLRQVYSDVHQLLVEFRPDYLAIERLFFNRNTTTALAVGEARGVVLLAASQLNVSVVEYTPQQVKLAVTGQGRADKQQVGRMVQSVLALPAVPTPDDVADALAIAVCHLNHRKGQDS